MLARRYLCVPQAGRPEQHTELRQQPRRRFNVELRRQTQDLVPDVEQDRGAPGVLAKEVPQAGQAGVVHSTGRNLDP